MRRAFGFVVVYLLISQALLFIPNTSSENANLEWTENISIEGSCSTENVRTHFQVNRTVVEIIVNLSWTTENGYTNLDMQIEDANGYVANASSSTQMPEMMRVREFPNRGRWTFVVVPSACGSCEITNYTANITLRNIILPEFVVSNDKIEVGNNVSMSINSACENVSHYYFDFGDGTDSGWINQSSISIIYNTSGEYYPKAKVRYSDGTESDWLEGLIEVKGDEGKPDLLWMALVSAIILAIITFLAFFMLKRRKGI